MPDVLMIGPFPEDPSLIKGGVQASVYGLARALLKQSGIDNVTVLALPIKADRSPVRSAKVEGLDVIYLNAPYRFNISSVVHLRLVLRKLKQLRQPVVHIHGTGLFQAVLLFALLHLKRIPFVWTLHGITEKETQQYYREHHSIGNLGRYLLYTCLERFSLWIAPNIIVDTPYVKDAIPATRNPVHVIRQGIFTEEFISIRDVKRHASLIVALGVLSPRKGHHLTLEAFARVKEKMPQARLIIAGASPVSDYHPLLIKRAAELGVADAVEIRANIPRSQVVALLGQARVFALHSQEESQGIALCEALAAGVPVVATRIGGIPFVVTDRQDGFLVLYGDVAGFANALLRLLADEPLYARMSEQARISSQRFDWHTIAGEVAEIYRRASSFPSPFRGRG